MAIACRNKRITLVKIRHSVGINDEIDLFIFVRMGGVGKSTLAQMIAVEFARAGWRVILIDMHRYQRNTLQWAGWRRERGIQPIIDTRRFERSNVDRHLTCDLLVFDDDPVLDGKSFNVAEMSDLVVIPTGESHHELRAQRAAAQQLVDHGVSPKKILIVLNRVLGSVFADTTARRFFAEGGFQVANTSLPTRRGFQVAPNGGLAITEAWHPTLKKIANDLATEIAFHVCPEGFVKPYTVYEIPDA